MTTKKKRKPISTVPRHTTDAPSPAAVDAPPTAWAINVRFLLTSAGLMLVLLLVLVAWNRFQVRRMAASLLERADDAAENEEWADAVKYIAQYQRVRPKDVDARMKYARVFDKTAKSPQEKLRAIALYDLAIGVATPAQRDELLTRQTQLQLDVAQYDPRRLTMVERQAWELIGLDAGDAQRYEQLAALDAAHYPALRMLTVALANQIDEPGAVTVTDLEKAFRATLRLRPDDVEVAVAAATFLRQRMDNAAGAQSIMEDLLAAVCGQRITPENTSAEIAALIQARPPKEKIPEDAPANRYSSVSALLAAYELQFPDRDRLLDAALSVAEEDSRVNVADEDVQVYMMAGVRESVRLAELEEPSDEQRKPYEEAAMGYFRKAKAKAPQAVAPYLALANMQLRTGSTEGAIKTLQEAREPKRIGTDNWQINVTLADIMIGNAMRTNDVAARDQLMSDAKPVLAVIRSQQLKANRQLTPGEAILRSLTYDSLVARTKVIAGSLTSAAQQLERIVSQQAGMDNTAVEALISNLNLLAVTYGQLGAWDQAAVHLERAIESQPAVVAHRLAAAAARARAGQAAAAARHYEFAVNNLARSDGSSEIWRPSALVELVQNRWTALQGNESLDSAALKQAKSALLRDLQAAKQSSPQSWRLKLVESQLAMWPTEDQPADPAAAQERLREAEVLAPDERELWSRLVVAYESLGRSDEADRALQRLGELSDPIDRTLSQTQLLVMRQKFEDALALLDTQQASLPADATDAQRQALTVQRAAIRAAQLNDPSLTAEQRAQMQKATIETLEAIANSDAPSRDVLEQLIVLCMQQQRWEKAEEYEQKLRKVESEAGTLWKFYRANRLLRQAAENDLVVSTLAEIKRLQAEIETSRPTWHAGYYLAGLIAERESRADAAIDAYTRAMSLGQRDTDVLQRLVRLCNLRGDYAQAMRYLSQMTTSGGSQTGLNQQSVLTLLGLQDFDAAVQAAEQIAASDSENPQAYIFLAQVLTAAKRMERATEVLREASQEMPGEPVIWDALVNLLTTQDLDDQAREMLAVIESTTELEEGQRELCLAKANSQLQLIDDARMHFQKAVAALPQDEAVLTAYVQFLVKHGMPVEDGVDDRRQQLEKEIRRLVAQSPDSTSLRQALTILLATRDDRTLDELEESLNLLRGGENSLPNRRLRTRLRWASGVPEQQAEARKELELILRESVVVDANDRLLMAEMMEADGQLQLAQGEYLALSSAEPPNPTHMVAYIDFLLRQGDPSAARPWLDRLRETSAETIEYVTLQARWLKETGDEADIEPLVESFAQAAIPSDLDPEIAANRHRSIADVYTNLLMHRMATQHLRTAFGLAPGNPDNFRQLMLSLAREGKASEAVSICLQNQPEKKPAVLLAMALALMVAPDEKQAHELAEPTLEQVISARAGQVQPRNAQDRQILVFIASLRHVQGQYERAIAIYRDILRTNPDDALALNNLATVLAEQPGSQSMAMSVIEQAIKRSGATPGLLDTRGVVRLQLGEFESAIADLETASRSPNSDARYHFHLACAYDAVGRTADATASLQTAMRGDVALQILTPAERDKLTELTSKLLPQS